MTTAQARILIVAPDAAASDHVRVATDGQGFAFEHVATGVDGIESVRAAAPHLLVLDDVLPDISGAEVCRIVKSITPHVFVPVLLMRSAVAADEPGTAAPSWGCGADDYVTKPLQSIELRARVASMMRVKALEDALCVKRAEVDALATTDELSGLLNHHAMRARLCDEFMRSQRYNQALTLIMADVDHFRDVNERYGHLCGDEMLVDVGLLVQENVRAVDSVAHFGADKFLVILPRTQFAGALTVAERIRKAATDKPVRVSDAEHRVTVSLGMSCYPNKHVRDDSSLLRLAEQALVQAKQRGRNCICVHQQFGYRTYPGETGTVGALT